MDPDFGGTVQEEEGFVCLDFKSTKWAFCQVFTTRRKGALLHTKRTHI